MLFDWRHQFHAKALFSLIQTWLGFTERERRREINSFVSYRIAGGQINSLVTLLLGVTRKIYRHSACALRAWLLVCLSRRVIKHLRKCTFHFWNLIFKEPFSDFGVFHVFAAKIQTELDFEIQRSFLGTFSRTIRPRYCKDSLCSSSVLRNIILGFSFVQVWACSRPTFLLPLKDLAQQSGFITKHERPDHFPTLESCVCVCFTDWKADPLILPVTVKIDPDVTETERVRASSCTSKVSEPSESTTCWRGEFFQVPVVEKQRACPKFPGPRGKQL